MHNNSSSNGSGSWHKGNKWVNVLAVCCFQLQNASKAMNLQAHTDTCTLSN
jgi:hypothetical protein